MNEQSLERRKQIGGNLAYARQSLELTQNQVALKIFGDEAKYKKISEIERGFRLPDAELLQTLCLFYGVSSDWVLGFSEAIELDPLIGNANVLFMKVATQIDTAVQRIAIELCQLGAKQIPKLPKRKYLEILNLILEIKDISPNNAVLLKQKMNILFNLANQSKKTLNRQDKILERQIDSVFKESPEYSDTQNLLTNIPKKSQRAKHVFTLNKCNGVK